jgi:hypothetical protein
MGVLPEGFICSPWRADESGTARMTIINLDPLEPGRYAGAEAFITAKERRDANTAAKMKALIDRKVAGACKMAQKKTLVEA